MLPTGDGNPNGGSCSEKMLPAVIKISICTISCSKVAEEKPGLALLFEKGMGAMKHVGGFCAGDYHPKRYLNEIVYGGVCWLCVAK